MLKTEDAMATIKELRERKGWSQVELAVEAAVSPTMISRLENNHPVGRSTLRRVCKALGVDINDVSGYTLTERKPRR